MIYDPREDSEILAKHAVRLSFGKVLDVGSGSGFQAENALKNPKVEEVIRIDKDEESFNYLKELEKKYDRFKALRSDLFEKVSELYDVILFNPPYLPEDENEDEKSSLITTGGKKGYELIDIFLRDAYSHLKPEGMILLVFSDLTGKAVVDDMIERYGFIYEQLEKKRLPFFETLFVYKISKNQHLRNEKFQRVKRFNKGKRGIIYGSVLDGKKVSIKIQRDDIYAKERIVNEARMLKILNKKGIGPHLIYDKGNMIVYRFIEGMLIKDYLDVCSSSDLLKVIRSVMKQCKIMDDLKINKLEMTNPYKHIIVSDHVSEQNSSESTCFENVVLVDFERCYETEKPKNVTQFCQYVSSGKIVEFFDSKGFNLDVDRLRDLARRYKRCISDDEPTEIKEKIFGEILDLFVD